MTIPLTGNINPKSLWPGELILIIEDNEKTELARDVLQVKGSQTVGRRLPRKGSTGLDDRRRLF